MKKIYINGKFLAQPATGVQRFAYGLVEALDRSLRAKPVLSEFEVLLPPNSRRIEGLKVVGQRKVGGLVQSLTAWEQLALPAASADGTLICLSGSAPFFSRDCVPTIHDAAVYLHPYAYSKRFVSWYRLLFARRARHSPLVLTVSHSAASELCKQLPPTNMRVIPNSAEHITEQTSDMSVINRLQLQKGKFVLAVGSLNPTKNFKNLVDAYIASDLGQSLPLVIVGGVNAKVFGKLSIFEDHPMVRWAGPVTDGQLRAMYEQAIFFVFPSLYEGFGIPPLEAMICGCPVAASNIQAVAEVCGNAVLYFDPTDKQAMTGAMDRLFRDDLCRMSLVAQGYQQVSNFSWDTSAEKLRAALLEFQYIK